MTVNIYKIKKGNQISNKTFTLKKANEIKKKFKLKGIEVEVKFYKTVKSIDFLEDGEVEFYS